VENGRFLKKKRENLRQQRQHAYKSRQNAYKKQQMPTLPTTCQQLKHNKNRLLLNVGAVGAIFCNIFKYFIKKNILAKLFS
jgi:hypothetical protein